jgi:hypothetical protein
MTAPFRTHASAIALALAGCATSALASPWFVGEFRGAADATSQSRMTVICRAEQACAVSESRPGSPPTPVDIPIQGAPKVLDPEIPDNNWEITRKAAASRPEWYDDPSFGPLLKPLRRALESGARFAQCADVDGTGYLALCSLSGDPDAAKGAMLLVSTMNPGCGGVPLCAYYFIPLERVPGQSRR